MHVSMPGTEEQGATTAASLFGVFKETVSDDDSGFIDLWFVTSICCLLLLLGIIYSGEGWWRIFRARRARARRARSRLPPPYFGCTKTQQQHTRSTPNNNYLGLMI
jgi:hypothetical protein